jgi:hypothetical protein
MPPLLIKFRPDVWTIEAESFSPLSALHLESPQHPMSDDSVKLFNFNPQYFL